MSTAMSHKSIWWKEPMVWLIISLPLAAVIGGFLTLWIAASDPDSLVAEDYYKQGMAIHQVLEKDARAVALRLVADIESSNGELKVRLQGRLDRYPDRLTLAMVHPSRADEDRTVALMASMSGEYRGELPSMTPGQRHLILQPLEADWRLAGRAFLPFTTPVRLEATAADSPTHP